MKNTHLLAVSLALASLTLTLAGCGATNTSVYPGTGTTYDLAGDNVEIIGQVSACQGAWCKNDETGNLEWAMSLQTPPPASTYQAALRKKAARVYSVPESEVIVGEITVGYHTELDGTIRGWSAEAVAGRRKAAITEAKGSSK